MKQYELKFSDERKMLQNEMSSLQEKVLKLNNSEKKCETIIQDYKQIIQRQEQQLSKLTDSIDGMTKTMRSCQTCSSQINNDLKDSFKADHPLGPLDPLNEASLRIRELELELAQAKLDKVEAECRSQDLNHQLSSTLSELQVNKSVGNMSKDKDNTSWQPSWMSKTLNSIQEKVKKDNQNSIPSFQSYTSDITQVRTISLNFRSFN